MDCCRLSGDEGVADSVLEDVVFIDVRRADELCAFAANVADVEQHAARKFPFDSEF